jgi:hypothetical protein
MFTDDDRLNSAAVLGSRIAELVRSAEHDSALMAPKLLKARVMAEDASAGVIFKIRAVTTQRLVETCIPVAAQAVTDVERLLSAGVSPQTFLRCWF